MKIRIIILTAFLFSTKAIYSQDINVSENNHYIGELFGGGVVFYLDHTQKHGLICSLIDISDGYIWSNVSDLIGKKAQSRWDGKSNSTAIIEQNGCNTSAAQLCENYTNVDYGTGAFSDWYLPAIDELNLLYNTKYQINKAIDLDENPATKPINDIDEGVSNSFYWSSTEDNTKCAFYYYFYSGTAMGHLTPSGGKFFKSHKLKVRAIRSF